MKITTNKRFWECTCCAQLIVTNKQDDATEYDCPACKASGCNHNSKFTEISLSEFCKEIKN